jgi:hypothetical protein
MLISDYPSSTVDRYLPVEWNVKNKKVKKLYTKGGSFPKFELLAETLTLETVRQELITISVFTQNILNNGKKYPTNLNPDHPANIFIAKLIRQLFTELSNRK